jgi:predicted nucleotidyltransferase
VVRYNPELSFSSGFLVVNNELASLAHIVRDWASNHGIVRKVYFFGSRVRGTNRPNSDLDVAIEIDARPGDASVDLTWHDEGRRLRNTLKPLLFPVKLDLQLDRGEKESPIIHKALTQGSIVVYERPTQL